MLPCTECLIVCLALCEALCITFVLVNILCKQPRELNIILTIFIDEENEI